MLTFLFLVSLSYPSEVITLTAIEVPALQPTLDSRSVTVITSDDIQKSKTRNVAEILRRAAGVDLISNTQSGQATATIRGGAGGQTLVVIDGVKANDPSEGTRSFDFSSIDPQQIERIEILKGPQAVAFGSDATSGAIIIKTKASKKSYKTRTTIQTEAGSRETLRNSILLKHSFDPRFSLQTQLRQRSTKGPTGNAAKAQKGDLDGSDEYEGQLRLQAFFNILELTLGADHKTIHQDTDDSSFTDDLDSITRIQESRFFLQTAAEIDKQTKMDFLVSRVHNRRNFVNTAFADQTYRGGRWDIENRYETTFDKEFKLLFGAELKQEELEIDSPVAVSRLSPQHQRSYSLFTQGLWNLSDETSLDLGFRGDHYDTFGNTLNFRTGVKHAFSKILEWNAGAGSGFKAPALFSLYDQTYGNRDLKPEKSITYETGLLLTPNDQIQSSIQVFQTHAKDLFGSGPAPTYLSMNVSKARLRGVEWENQIQATTDLTLRTHLTYLRARNLTTRQDLSNRARFKGGMTIEEHWNEQHQTHLEWIAKSRPVGGAPGYGLLHATQLYTFNSSLTASLRLENILDQDYQEVLGYHSNRRSFYASLEYKF